MRTINKQSSKQTQRCQSPSTSLCVASLHTCVILWSALPFFSRKKKFAPGKTDPKQQELGHVRTSFLTTSKRKTNHEETQTFLDFFNSLLQNTRNINDLHFFLFFRCPSNTTATTSTTAAHEHKAAKAKQNKNNSHTKAISTKGVLINNPSAVAIYGPVPKEYDSARIAHQATKRNSWLGQ